jgi:bifunctional polynucleotide phosphatase/kinase
VRCFKFKTDLKLCYHLNYVRQNQTKGEVRRIPDVAYNIFKNQNEEPTLKEGFTEIIEIDFDPHFESSEDEVIFKQWTNH